MKKILLPLLLVALLLLRFVPSSLAAVTNPAEFPVFDPFTNATAAGGSSYAVGSTLAGQTNALGSYWYSIDSTGSAANTEYLTNIVLSYPGLPPGPGGNVMVLTNAAGPGVRMFVATNSTGFLTGTAANPMHFYYSFVVQVLSVTTLSATGQYLCGVGDQGTIANQTSNPGTVGARLYLEQTNSTNFLLGISKMSGPPSYDPTPFTTSQVLFIVVDYEGLVDGIAGSDIARLWVNPAASTFGNEVQPLEATNNSTGSDFGPDISCVQIYNIANSANQTLMTDYRMGTNWSWVTGGPLIRQQPVPVINSSSGISLNVTAFYNGSTNTFQWQFDGVNLTNGPSISGSGATVSGATNATLTITDTTALDAGSYDVIVSNAVGAVISSVTMALSYTYPVFTVQPSPTNVLFYVGGPNSFTLAATILGLPVITNYLYSNSTLVATSTNQSFSLTNLQTDANFHVVASNAYGMATSAVVSVTVLPLPSAPYPQTVLGDHPIGFWPLNEDAGVTAYDYVGGNDGVYTNVVLDLPGYGPGLAAEFGYATPTDTSTSVAFGANGVTSNSYVGAIPNIDFGAATAPSFSVEAWVNAQGNTQVSGAGIVSKGEAQLTQFALEYGSAGWEFFVNSGKIVVFDAFSSMSVDTSWHHLVGAFDANAGEIRLYVDGVQQSSTAVVAANGILESAYPVVIGSRAPQLAGALSDQFNGNIQDVAIYNYALSPGQVANHYAAAGTPPSVSIPSSTNINEGATLIVPATVVGIPPFTYQWYDVTSATTTLTNQTNSSLVITNISAADYQGHNLDVVVSNAYGATTCSPINLNIYSGPPGSVALSPSSITAYAGWPLLLTVLAQGTEQFSYQWLTNGVIVPGVTGAVYTNVVLLGGPLTIQCTVSNSFSDGSPATVSGSITGVAAPTDSYALDVLGDNPLAYWRLDEPLNAGTANDYVGGHDANYNNATNGLPGFRPVAIPSETAAGFGMNGVTNNSVAVEQDNTGNGIPLIDFSTEGPNGEFSVEAWLNAPAGQLSGAGIVANGSGNGGEQFCLDTGGTGGAFRFFVRNSSATVFAVSSLVLPNGNWHHLVGVCDQANGLITFYVDGKSVGTAPISAGTGVFARNANLPVSIGSRSSSSTDYEYLDQLINTSMDDVAIYNYPLTSNQVAAHYALGLVSLAINHVAGNNTAVISWPPVNGYVVQQSSSLSTTNWVAATNSINVVNGQNQIVVPITNGAQYYRLALP